MRELLTTLDAWRREGIGFGRAVVVRTMGSAPRPEGAVLLAADDGRLEGSVSGGCVEGAVHEEVGRARRSGRTWLVRYGITDEEAWGVGLACGGTIDVLVQPEVAQAVVDAAMASGVGGSGGRALAWLLPPADPGEAPRDPLVIDADGRLEGSLGDPSSDDALRSSAREALERGLSRTVTLAGRDVFIEALPARPRLVIVGAVQAAMSLVRFARELGYETIVVDGRAAFATQERFPDADQLIVAWPDEAAEQIGLGAADAVAVLSHDPRIDDVAISEALRRGCRYVGAVGSRSTQAARRERLRAAGFEAADLSRLRGPIGLDLGGRSTAEMALAIAAELVSARHGGSGLPLRDRARGR